jgi:hypothetical protein
MLPANTATPNLAYFLAKPSIGDWVKLIDGSGDAAEDGPPVFVKHMVKGKDKTLPPLFLIHPMSGLSGAWNMFCKKYGNERDIYVIEHPHYTDSHPLYVPVGELGDVYVNALLKAVGDRE